LDRYLRAGEGIRKRGGEEECGIIGESGGLGTESEAIRDSGTHSDAGSGQATAVPSDPVITAISAALEAAAKAGQFDVVQSLAAQLVMLRAGDAVSTVPARADASIDADDRNRQKNIARR